MASNFIWRGTEEAKQAIAAMQVEAAAAENASRERIAKEQTQQQRYATQAQISEREKDRQVHREDYALRRDIISANQKLDADFTRDAATKERAKLQLATILQSLNSNANDPPTQREMEAILAGAKDLTDDQRKAVLSIHADAVKVAKADYAMGKKIADNYMAELKGKAPTDPALPDIYKRITADRNVIFDRATGKVESVFRQPREDAAIAPPASRLGQSISPAQDYGGASTTTASGAVPTISQIKASVTGAPAAPVDTSGLGTAAPVLVAPPVTVSDIAPAYLGGRPTISGLLGAIPSIPMSRAIRTSDMSPLSSFIGPAAPRDPMRGPMERFRMPGGFGTPRVSDIAPPPTFSAPREFNLPQFASPAGDIDALVGIANDPRFPTLPAEHQQWILDQIGNASQRTPRASDLQRIRPEYVPMDQYLAP